MDGGGAAVAAVALVSRTVLPVHFRSLLDYPTDAALERALRQPQHRRLPGLLPKKDDERGGDNDDNVLRLEPSKKRRRGDEDSFQATPPLPAPEASSSPPSLLATSLGAEDGEEGHLHPHHHPHHYHHECSWDWRIDAVSAAATATATTEGSGGSLKPAPDSDLSEPQTLEKELERLRVLRSYAHLLANRNDGRKLQPPSSTADEGASDDELSIDESLQRITALGARWLSTPLCVVSLIDLGRAIILTAHGPFPSDKLVQARHHSLCSYAILSTTGFLVVPDCSRDARFGNLNVVTMDGGVRFYAGAVLRSPEGHRLGAIAVASPIPRSQGLSSIERQSLRDLADLVSQTLGWHRQLREQRHQLALQKQTLASTSHALATPLSALQLSLHLLSGDPDVRRQLCPPHHDLLTTATQCAAALGDACESLRTTNRTDEGSGGGVGADDEGRPTTPAPETEPTRHDDLSHCKHDAADAEAASNGKVPGDIPHSLSLALPVPLLSVAPPPPSPLSLQGTTVHDLIDKLRWAAKGLPASVPVAISFESSERHAALQEVVERCSTIPEPLRLFRAVLDLLVHACERTTAGSVALVISVEVRAAGDVPSPAVRVECRDNGPRLLDEHGGAAAATSSPRLRFVVESVRQLGGTFGIRAVDGPAHTRCCWCTVPLKTAPDELPPVEVWPTPASKRSVSELSLSSASGAATGRWQRREQTPALSPHLINADAEQFLGSIVAPVPGSLFLLRGSSPLQKRRRALIIDDSLVVRKVLANALARLGFHTEQAVDGMDGLRQLQSKRFDLVLCDFLMPVMDGLDCVREYRRWEAIHRPHFRQFIVGMSAHATGPDVDQSLSLGMNDYRSKPLTLDVLQSLERSRQGIARCESTDTVASVRNRRCPSPTSRRLLESHHGVSKACLVATSDPAGHSQIDQAAAQYGWTCISAGSGDEALDLLRRRNWGAALLDNDLIAMHSIHEFRAWEKRNRVHRQSNIFLMSSDLGTSAQEGSQVVRTYVQVPDGVDGAINKPPRKEDLEGLFTMRKSDDLSHAFKASDIITR